VIFLLTLRTPVWGKDTEAKQEETKKTCPPN